MFIRGILTLITLIILICGLASCGGEDTPVEKEASMYCGLFDQQVVREVTGFDKDVTVTGNQSDPSDLECTLSDPSTDEWFVLSIAVAADASLKPKFTQMLDDEALKSKNKDVTPKALIELGHGYVRERSIDDGEGGSNPQYDVAVLTDTHVLRLGYRPTDAKNAEAAEGAVKLAKNLDANLKSFESGDLSTSSADLPEKPLPGSDAVAVADMSKLSSRLG